MGFQELRDRFLDCISFYWKRWGFWKKFLCIFILLFVLFGSSWVALISLPLISGTYFCTCIVKNIMEISANWRWGPLLPKRRNRPSSNVASQRELGYLQVGLNGWGSLGKVAKQIETYPVSASTNIDDFGVELSDIESLKSFLESNQLEKGLSSLSTNS
ncbi:hypothetical protein MHLP_00990 [Candidatus Mycoplasma haematolamae str. Purdue]|uniref:Uncharacterized protein n=1 Tax=Mycoplasma haematolamae (strain Purdue) TaxID=1212765 RepID=I7BIX5_MYCHA|nr:hypothetical protein [Candidatus Mycoplasma haematolamae]AFO51778.1 hypothetical protein MHLP_00990 [Candidatus Mycoplasma haematolamae str. Purdue]